MEEEKKKKKSKKSKANSSLFEIKIVSSSKMEAGAVPEDGSSVESKQAARKRKLEAFKHKLKKQGGEAAT